MMEEKKNPNEMSDEELEDVSGGFGGRGGFTMTVKNLNGSYLALLPHPVLEQDHELEQLYEGNQVFTTGATASGTGLNGAPCNYRYVCYNGSWGWADAAYLF